MRVCFQPTAEPCPRCLDGRCTGKRRHSPYGRDVASEPRECGVDFPQVGRRLGLPGVPCNRSRQAGFRSGHIRQYPASEIFALARADRSKGSIRPGWDCCSGRIRKGRADQPRPKSAAAPLFPATTVPIARQIITRPSNPIDVPQQNHCSTRTAAEGGRASAVTRYSRYDGSDAAVQWQIRRAQSSPCHRWLSLTTRKSARRPLDWSDRE